MALSKFVIRMNYNNSIKQAQRLEEAAEDLRRLVRNDLDGSLDSVRSAWTGDNANAFLIKGEQLKEKISKTASGMEQTARAIRTIAKNIYDAEMRNYYLING